MRHTQIALQRPVTTVVVFVALALVGLIASRLLPLEKFPDIEFPGIFIQVPYPGSTPEEVERRALECFRQLDRRRTIRDFSPEPVPRSVIENLVRAASTAPSPLVKETCSRASKRV